MDILRVRDEERFSGSAIIVKLLINFGFRQVGNNLIESYAGYLTYIRMELSNPNGGGEKEGDAGDADLA